MPAPAAPLLQHLFCNFSAGYLLLNFPVATAQLVYSLPNQSCRRLPYLYCNFSATFSMPFPPRLFCCIGLIEPFYAGVFAVHLYCLIDPTGCLRYRIGPAGVCRIFTATFLLCLSRRDFSAASVSPKPFMPEFLLLNFLSLSVSPKLSCHGDPTDAFAAVAPTAELRRPARFTINGPVIYQLKKPIFSIENR